MAIDRDRARFGAALFFVGLPAELASFFLSDRVIAAHCPAGTFLFGSLEPDMHKIGILGAMLPLTFMVAAQLKRVPWFKNPDDEWDTPLLPPYVLPLVFAGFAGLFALGTLSRFCASDSGIVYDDVADRISMTYGWGDVAAVHTSCVYETRRSGGSWHGHFFVIMGDGNSVDLNGDETRPDMPIVYPKIAAALDGRKFSFSTSIDPKCGFSHMEMLTTRPGTGYTDYR